MVEATKTNIELPSNGDLIRGILTQPIDDSPLVVPVHGFTGNLHENGLFDEFALKVAKKGFSCFQFSFRDTPPSDGDFIKTSIRKQVIDLQRVISWAKNDGFNEIHLVATSLGASVALLALPLDLHSLTLWNPAFDLKNTILRDLLTEKKQEELAKYGYLQDPHDPTIKIGKTIIREIPSIQTYDRIKLLNLPVFIIHGVSDSVVPATQSTHAFSLAKEPKKLTLVDGAEHGFPGHEKQLFSETIDFLLRYKK